MHRSSGSDFLVIGSGISGACAAQCLVELGASTRLLDVGVDDPESRAAIPDRSFDEIRNSDRGQADYFIGKRREGVPKKGVVVGAQLTPPRQFLDRQSADHFPVAPGTFRPLISTAIGGLGAGW